MNDGMEQAQRLTQVRGAVVVGLSLPFSFLIWSMFQFLVFHLSVGMKGSGGETPPSSRLARRWRGCWVKSYSN